MPSGIPARDELVAGAGELGGDLVGVVDVDVQPQRVVLGEHLAQLVVDALGHEHRHPGSDAHDLHVRDLAQAAERRLQQLGREREAVAARDQHVADLGVVPDVVELGLVLLAVEVLGGVADDPAPRAVAAVHRALGGDQHQDAVRVAVDQARDGRVPVLGEAVLHHPREAAQLAPQRDDLAADRVVRVVGIHEAGEVGRDVDPELVGRGQALALLVGELEDLLEVSEIVDAVAELPLPVVPLLGRHVGPQRCATADRGQAVRPQAQRRVALVHEGRGLHRGHAARSLRLLRHLPNLPLPAAHGGASRNRSDA